MLALYWPIALLVLSNVFYHIMTKSILPDSDPYANIFVTYIVGAIISLILFFTIGKGGNIAHEITQMNWAPYILGCSIVGLEVGAIYMYKVGWDISIGNTVQAILVSIVLLLVGFLIYKEAITTTRLIGMAVCMLGIYLLNK